MSGVPVTLTSSLNMTATLSVSPMPYRLSVPEADVNVVEVVHGTVSTTVMVLVDGVLRLSVPWLSSVLHVTVRAVETAVGLFVVLRNVTARKAFWYSAGVAVPVRVSTPVVESYAPLIGPIVEPSFVNASSSPVVRPVVIETVADVRVAVSASVTSMPVSTTPAGAASV